MPVDQASDTANFVLDVLRHPDMLQAVVQPIVNIATATVAGWEVLTRARDHESVRPSVLFEAAKGMGVVAELHVVALREALELRRTMPEGTFLTVNVDPIAVVSSQVRNVLAGEEDLSGLVIELVETGWPSDPSALLSYLSDLRSQGAKIAVDDVGAGYSGLSQLMAVRPELIKLDKSLIQNLPTDPAAQALVTAVSLLSGTLDAWTVVEGIETEEQLRTVADLGVPLVQGYIFGRPSAAWPSTDEISARVRAVGLSDRTGIHEVGDLMRALRPEELRLDTHGRPSVVIGSAGEHPALPVAPTTAPAVALRRALDRSKEHRLAPLVVTSPVGQPLGMVDIDDLVIATTGSTGPTVRKDVVRLPPDLPNLAGIDMDLS